MCFSSVAFNFAARLSFFVRNNDRVGVCPEFFQLVVIPQFLVEYVYDNIPIIKHNPLRRVLAFYMKWPFVYFLAYMFLYSISHTCNMCAGSPMTYYEEITKTVFDFS